jgi:FMN phosphatase YigB (HAD superfamily)
MELYGPAVPAMFDPASVRALIFDYGNTVIPYGRPELARYGDRVFDALVALYGPLDRVRFDALRQAMRMQPYEGNPPTYRENDMAEITAMLVRELHGGEAARAELDQLLEVRHDAFVDAVTVDSETLVALRALADRFPLGLLSNYPDAPAIRTSLDRLGLTPLFSSVVISGELGLVKPHPATFAKSLDDLGRPAAACLFVGDNWLADVQGAKAAGMQVAHMQRWAPPESFERSATDHRPDLEIQSLAELVPILPEGAVA